MLNHRLPKQKRRNTTIGKSFVPMLNHRLPKPQIT